MRRDLKGKGFGFVKRQLNSILAIISFVALAPIFCARAIRAPDLPELPNFDKRVAVAVPQVAHTPEQAAAATSAKTRNPGLQIDFDPTLGSPKWIYSRKGFVNRPTRDFLTHLPSSFIGPLPAPDVHKRQRNS